MLKTSNKLLFYTIYILKVLNKVLFSSINTLKHLNKVLFGSILLKIIVILYLFNNNIAYVCINYILFNTKYLKTISMKPISVINNFGMTKLDNSEHSDLHASIYKYLVDAGIDVINCTEENLATYQKAQKLEEALIGRQTASIITADVTLADNERGMLLSYLFATIDTIAKSLLAEEKEIGAQLRLVLKPFRGIRHYPIAEENTAVRSLLSCLGTAEMQPLVSKVAGLLDILDKLEVANNKVCDVLSKRTSKMKSKAESRARRAETDNCYLYIKQRIDAKIVMDNTPELQRVKKEINNLLLRTKNVYNIRMGVVRRDDAKVAEAEVLTTKVED